MSFAERRRFLWILFLIGAALTGAVAAMGTTLVAMPFEELATRATAVARLRCVGTHSFVEDGEIWTETQFETVAAHKGLLGKLVVVRMPGGKANGLHTRVDGVPEFAMGEEVYLFLWTGRDGGLRVLGWTQGTFRIQRDERTGNETVTQDSSNGAVFDAKTKTFRREGIREMSVAKFEEKLRAALANREN